MGAQTIVTRQPFLYGKLIWRFATGNFMDGQRHGDSTWFRRASDRQSRLNAWTRMARIQRAAIRWFLTIYLLSSIALAIWAPDLFWLLLGLTGAYWIARLFIWLDHKMFHHTRGGRVTHYKVQRKIDALPDPVAKLFGGKTEHE